MTTTTISGAGAHASAEDTDRIPASKAGVKGYLTLSAIWTRLQALTGLNFTAAVRFLTIELGAATDTTLARASAGKVSVEGVTLLDTGDLYTTAYSSAMNGVTNKAVVPDVVYDKFESRLPTPITTAWVVARPEVHALNNGAALAADTIYYSAVWIWNHRTISDLGFRLHATTSANNVKLAIYANNASTNRPTGNPVAVTGNISMASTGNLSADITGADVTLTPGLYWFAIWAEGTTGSISANGASDGISLAIGDTTLANLSSGDGANWGYTLTSAESFAGGTFPDAAGETFTLVARTTAARTYQFYMKVV